MTSKSAPQLLIPVKNLAAAKLRLANVLNAAERSSLMLAMLGDVLAATRAAGLPTTVLSPDATVRRFAELRSAVARPEHPGATSLNEALEGALRHWANDTNPVLILHGDTPLVTAAELGCLVTLEDEETGHAGTTAGRVVIVPDRAESGTNALLLRPPTVIPLRFGPNSMAGHVEATRARGVTSAICRLPGIGLDLDTADDLRAFLAVECQTETRRLLEGLRIADRLALRGQNADESRKHPCPM